MPGKMCSVIKKIKKKKRGGKKEKSLKEKYFSVALCAQKCVCLWKAFV
jgi:hypothetical protein